MKSYGIPVKGFTVQDLPDIKDLNERFYHKLVKISSYTTGSIIRIVLFRKVQVQKNIRKPLSRLMT